MLFKTVYTQNLLNITLQSILFSILYFQMVTYCLIRKDLHD